MLDSTCRLHSCAMSLRTLIKPSQILLIMAGALVALTLLHCTPPPSKSDEGLYSNGQRRYTIERDEQGRKHGLEKWWHENGQVKYETRHLDGFREGRYVAFYGDGKMWYEGFEHKGRPESTLTYWHPNGKMRTQAFFRDGVQLKRRDFDFDGNPLLNQSQEPLLDESKLLAREDSLKANRVRQMAIGAWSKRVQATVESYWVVPKEIAARGPLKTVASITVSRNGKILNVAWKQKSPHASFNRLAEKTFTRVKKLPPFPVELPDQQLTLQYEFVTSGPQEAKSRLRDKSNRLESSDVKDDGIDAEVEE